MWHVVPARDGGMRHTGPLHHQGAGAQPHKSLPRASPDGSTAHRAEEHDLHVTSMWLLQGFWHLQVRFIVWSVIGHSGT